MRVTVNVTEKHINKGTIRSPYSCPIALALSENKATEIYGVSTNALFLPAHIRDTGKKRSIKLPQAARKFIDNFDDNKPVKPFKFTITGV